MCLMAVLMVFQCLSHDSIFDHEGAKAQVGEICARGGNTLVCVKANDNDFLQAKIVKQQNSTSYP